MITKKVIDELYRRYKRRPKSVDMLDMDTLFTRATEHHQVAIDDDANLVVGSIDPHSPFHRIALDRIHAIYGFDDVVAVVLHSSILFLNTLDRGVNVHVKFDKPSLWERMRWRLFKR